VYGRDELPMVRLKRKCIGSKRSRLKAAISNSFVGNLSLGS
jgi:hypothetical protein